MKAFVDKAGLKTQEFSFTIERGKIKEFVQAIGDRNPIYHELTAALEQGYEDIPIPPTFATVIEMWAGLDFEKLIELLQLNPLNVLHGEQEYEYMKTICAGEVISGQMEVVKHVQKGNMDFFKLETVFRNSTGLIAMISRSTVIERH
ncbi:FAS1-like dehydratase domain-containing protein [Falsibacillus pallidus]|uniref:MaoC dehydratase-like protein n=1 Tax=Falsibacillus pallidus TaxID=493781 RepID=A0A370GHE3_9BACI|nr:MaoC family dehydratase N-terminal domain-containing protein [Falsibacillus pallidus]RDI43228.1 MaoC dehydratase-like protein [Falsibacillus pallidus]